MSVKIERLCIYPIKSLPGIDIELMRFDDLGAEHDRRYMLVDHRGQFISQRTFAKLCLINLTATVGGWQLQCPDSSEQKFLPYVGEQKKALAVEIWSDSLTAFDQGDEWATFFSDYLNHSARLVYLPADSLRRIDQAYCAPPRYVSFADGFPLLLTSASSVDALNEQLAQKIDIERFRPNIHVSGVEAFAERQWKAICVSEGEGVYSVVKPCSRCVIPTINPDTAAKQKEVWQVLKELCGEDDGNIYFGQNLIHQDNTTVLQLGQQLEVTVK